LFMWFVLWSGSGASIGLAVFASSFAGLTFGLCMAAYYSYGRHKHKLPRWNQLNAVE
jgi:Family of unknown function (DUF6404)